DYLAPEQALDPHTADIRADIYSLGCTLYFLLTGQPPFPGGTMAQKLLWHQQAEPTPIESLCPGLPPGVAAVARRMTAKRPEGRYRAPAEVALAVAPFCSTGAPGVVEPAQEPSVPELPGAGQVPAVRPEPAPGVRASAGWALSGFEEK